MQPIGDKDINKMEKNAMTDYTNRLINEKSPYLLQHAHNPVDWYPWGEEAFQAARRDNKLIFLSIGYSTCHWCHVMERESFESPDVAKVLNRVFVCIKVDREERPDLDSTYMAVSQMMTGTGGWPLNVILTPDRIPVFAMTYIPRESRGGQMGIMELANQINELWTEGKEEVERRAAEILTSIRGLGSSGSRGKIDSAISETVFQQMRQMYDSVNGGFGNAPKFPSPHNLMFLLRYHFRRGNQEALDMVIKTLKSMRLGGIYDHIGSGFHRYSTDASWMLPHFEKMIYDQAYLLMAYTEAYGATGDHFFLQVVHELTDFLKSEMRAPEGAFITAMDADSEGQEGKFYTWTVGELRSLLNPDELELFMDVYNIDPMGNYLDEATGRSTGRNILYMTRSMEEEARDRGIPADEFALKMDRIRQKVYGFRERRIKPQKDDKILTDMNGLVIAALSKAYRATGDKEILEMARKAADFIISHMIQDGRVLHRYRSGEAAIHGYVDDYSFFTFGMLELFLSTMEARYLKTAMDLSESLKKYFTDSWKGGYFYTPDDGEALPVRMKEGHDSSVPSGNSVQVLNLARLYTILSRDDFRAEAINVASAFAGEISKSPMFFSFMAIGIDYLTGSNYLVKVHSGTMEGESTMKAIWEGFYPNTEVIATHSDNRELNALLEEPMSLGKEDLDKIFVCTSMNCLPPVNNRKEVLQIISGRSDRRNTV